MTDILQITSSGAENLSEVMSALERAAVAHAIDLRIDFPRMLKDFGCLWMIARCRVQLDRFPQGEFQIKTWLRTPTATVSNRDFSLTDAAGEFGRAVQTWVLAEAESRRIANLKKIPVLWELPIPQPERTDVLRRLGLPQELHPCETWTVTPDQIDNNGHLNNVHYVRRAEALVPEDCRSLEITFDRECFAGETLTLELAQGDGFFVRGVRSDGLESFRARFW